MGKGNNKAEIKVVINADQFNQGLRAVKTSWSGFVTGLNQSAELLSKVVAPFMAGIQAAGAQEQVYKSLQNTLKNTGLYTKSFAADIDELAKKISDTSIYEPESVLQGIDSLLKYNNISADILPRTTQVMVDLASVMGADVPSAAKLLGQSSEEMTRGLAMYGIFIDPAIAKSGDFSKVLGAVEGKVKGHAAAMANTGYGGYIKMNNAIDDVTKEFGKFALQVGEAGVFSLIQSAADEAGKAIGEMLDSGKATALCDAILDAGGDVAMLADTVWSMQDKIPTEALEYGLLGYMLLGKKGAIAGAITGIGKKAGAFGGGSLTEYGTGISAGYNAWQAGELSFSEYARLSSKGAVDLARGKAPELVAAEERVKNLTNELANADEEYKDYIQSLLDKAQERATFLSEVYEKTDVKTAGKRPDGGGGVSQRYQEWVDKVKAGRNKTDESDTYSGAVGGLSNTVKLTEEQIKFMTQLQTQTAAAGRELSLLQYPEGLSRDMASINMQAEEYLKNSTFAVKDIENWRNAQLKLTHAQSELNIQKERELEIDRQKEATRQAQAQRLQGINADTAQLTGQMVTNENTSKYGANTAELMGIRARAEQMKIDAGDNEELRKAAENWGLIAEAEKKSRMELITFKLDFDTVTDGMHEAFQSMESGIANALFNGTTSGLGQALAESLKMFAAQKTAHLLMEAAYETTMGVATMMNPTRAWESGFHFSSAKQYALGAALMGTFVMASNIKGMAHDGMDYIPREGTWLLDKGERVVDSRTNKDLKEFISGAKGGDVVVNVTINGGDKDGLLEALPVLQQVIVDAVCGNIASGGQIKRTIREYA